MGWTALFLREEKAVEWIDAIMFELDYFETEPEEEVSYLFRIICSKCIIKNE